MDDLEFNKLAEEVESIFVFTKLTDNSLENLKIPEELGNKIKQTNLIDLDKIQLKRLGFHTWSISSGTLYLIPYYLFDYIPDGTKLIGIFGDTAIKGEDYIDLDTRFGCISFGFLKI
jgi:hypothetical protein